MKDIYDNLLEELLVTDTPIVKKDSNPIVPLKSQEIIDEAYSILNEDQKVIFDKILKFFEDDDKEWFVIEGFAGTGKTFLMQKVANCIDGAIAMSAPTNKAVKVLAENRDSMGSNVIYSTIHKLLSLRVKWQYPQKGSGEKPKQILVRNQRGRITMNDYLILVIDEVSMLDDKLLDMIKAEKAKTLKVIFMGDPAQIPPVNRYDSIPLIEKERNEWGMIHSELHQNMRQNEDNKILELSYQIRNNRFDSKDPLLSRLSNSDVIFYSSLNTEDKTKFFQNMLNIFDSNEFKEDSNYCKTIAWTNKTVNQANNIIRTRIFKTSILEKVMQGEKLIADSSIKNKNGEIIFNTSDEFTVLDFEIKSRSYSIPESKEPYEQIEAGFVDDMVIVGVDSRKKNYNFKYYDCTVEVKSGENEKCTVTMQILHEDSEQVFKFACNKVKSKKQWNEYIILLEMFAAVKYNYAITAHKAQGSTYKIVFLLEDDIDQNKKTLERNRIKYTACTRPKYKLHILSKWNQTLKIQNNILESDNGH